MAREAREEIYFWIRECLGNHICQIAIKYTISLFFNISPLAECVSGSFPSSFAFSRPLSCFLSFPLRLCEMQCFVFRAECNWRLVFGLKCALKCARVASPLRSSSFRHSVGAAKRRAYHSLTVRSLIECRQYIQQWLGLAQCKVAAGRLGHGHFDRLAFA